MKVSNEKLFCIRQARIDDAARIRVLQRTLDRETPYMLWEPGEEPDDVRVWEDRIRPFIESRHSAFWVVGGPDGALAGFLRVRGNSAERLAHSGLVVVGIRQRFWGQGLATKLFEELDGWAQARSLRRLELTVMVPNRRAVGLYLKMGFVVEGLRRDSIGHRDGSFVDEYQMAKIYHQAHEHE